MAVDEHPVRFTRGDIGPVVAALQDLASRDDGEAWINISPVVGDDDLRRVPDRSGLAGWFSSRGPAVPVATWMSASGGNRPRAAQIGLSHGTGPNALPRLAEHGIELPPGWVKRQDHAKHGVVAELPEGVDARDVIDWLLRAATALSDTVEAGDRWQAVVHGPV